MGDDTRPAAQVALVGNPPLQTTNTRPPEGVKKLPQSLTSCAQALRAAPRALPSGGRYAPPTPQPAALLRLRSAGSHCLLTGDGGRWP